MNILMLVKSSNDQNLSTGAHNKISNIKEWRRAYVFMSGFKVTLFLFIIENVL